MEAMTRDVWVFIETGETGEPESGLELLHAAKVLAFAQGGETAAVIIGGGAEAAVKEAAAYGADKAITVFGDEYGKHCADTYISALSGLIEKSCPETLLIGGTPLGRDLAAAVACRFSTGITTDVTAMEYENGSVRWTRPVFGGSYMAETSCLTARPQIGVAKPNAFKKTDREEGRAIGVESVEHHTPSGELRTALRELIHDIGESGLSIEDAQVIVSGGRGVGSAEGFDLLRELAELLGGAVGCSRAVTDSDWMPHSALVGQTGKTVAPKIYFACGISGAMQHTCGMADSDCIIAVNKDPDAPIFEIADYGVVGDLREVLPALIEEIKRSRA